MRINSVLLEGPYDPKLYHWTSFSSLYDILSTNKLEARVSKTGFVKWTDKKMVHFTRTPHATFRNDTGAVLVFDREKIANNYQLKLRYGDSIKAAAIAAANPEEYLPIQPRRESEEVIEKDLYPLSRYITHLVTFTHNWERLCTFHYARLRSRPLRGHGLLMANVMSNIIKYKIKVVVVDDLGTNWNYDLDSKALDVSTLDIYYFKRIIDAILYT